MRLLTALCALAFVTLRSSAPAFAGPQKDGYMLRDTTSLPPPATGMARLVVARDMRILDTWDPEYVFVDRTPIGVLAQRTAIATEVAPGWHRVWLGRGRKVGVWMEFVPDGRYLLRLREIMNANAWQGDLVRESGEGYAAFALNKNMKLAVMDERGRNALMRDLGRLPADADQRDSTARENAKARAALPIVIKEAWYLPYPSNAGANVWQSHTGTLTLDEQSLRYVRAETLVVEIPRRAITDVYFGSQKGATENPWIKIGYQEGGLDKGVTFADAEVSTATENYNRLFAELARGTPGH